MVTCGAIKSRLSFWIIFCCQNPFKILPSYVHVKPEIFGQTTSLYGRSKSKQENYIMSTPSVHEVKPVSVVMVKRASEDTVWNNRWLTYFACWKHLLSSKIPNIIWYDIDVWYTEDRRGRGCMSSEWSHALFSSKWLTSSKSFKLPKRKTRK